MSPHSDLAGDVSRAAAADPEANADPEEPPPEDDATWTREFFHEENRDDHAHPALSAVVVAQSKIFVGCAWMPAPATSSLPSHPRG